MFCSMFRALSNGEYFFREIFNGALCISEGRCNKRSYILGACYEKKDSKSLLFTHRLVSKFEQPATSKCFTESLFNKPLPVSFVDVHYFYLNVNLDKDSLDKLVNDDSFFSYDNFSASTCRGDKLLLKPINYFQLSRTSSGHLVYFRLRRYRSLSDTSYSYSVVD